MGVAGRPSTPSERPPIERSLFVDAGALLRDRAYVQSVSPQRTAPTPEILWWRELHRVRGRGFTSAAAKSLVDGSCIRSRLLRSPRLMAVPRPTRSTSTFRSVPEGSPASEMLVWPVTQDLPVGACVGVAVGPHRRTKFLWV